MLPTYLEKSEFSLFVIGQKTKSRTSAFSKRFSSTLSTYLEKSEFSLFIIGQKTKSRTSDLIEQSPRSPRSPRGRSFRHGRSFTFRFLSFLTMQLNETIDHFNIWHFKSRTREQPELERPRAA